LETEGQTDNHYFPIMRSFYALCPKNEK